MSDFPIGGNIEATKAWLDKEGFQGLFDGWKADSILGLEKNDIFDQVKDEKKALMIWGFLNTARRIAGK